MKWAIKQVIQHERALCKRLGMADNTLIIEAVLQSVIAKGHKLASCEVPRQGMRLDCLTIKHRSLPLSSPIHIAFNSDHLVLFPKHPSHAEECGQIELARIYYTDPELFTKIHKALNQGVAATCIAHLLIVVLTAVIPIGLALMLMHGC